MKSTDWKDSVTLVKFNHDGSYLAAADMSGCIKVWKIMPKLNRGIVVILRASLVLKDWKIYLERQSIPPESQVYGVKRSHEWQGWYCNDPVILESEDREIPHESEVFHDSQMAGSPLLLFRSTAMSKLLISKNMSENNQALKQDWKSFQSLPASIILVYCIGAKRG
jgi:hypothetical protein